MARKSVTGGRHRTVYNSREHTLASLKRACKGKPGCNPWAIANKGKTKAGRSAMARKAAVTRKRRGR